VAKGDYITDITVSSSDNRKKAMYGCPNGFEQVSQDMNEGSGGKYIYVCLLRGDEADAVKGVNAVVASEDDGECYDVVNPRNANAHGIDRGDNRDIFEFHRVHVNLNNGKYPNIHLCYSVKGDGALKDLKFTTTDACPAGYGKMPANFGSYRDFKDKVTGNSLQHMDYNGYWLTLTEDDNYDIVDFNLGERGETITGCTNPPLPLKATR